MPDIIDYTDSVGDVLAARWSRGGQKDITWGSQLTVRESQKAIFLRDGKAMCTFDPGRYVLTTQNIPILTKFITGFAYGSGNTPFLADVYFISTGLFKDLKWGTRGGGDGEVGGIPFTDPVYKAIMLRGYGSASIQIKDPVVFLSQQVKTAPILRLDDVREYLRSIIVEAIIDTLGELGKGILELPRFYREIGAGVKALLGDEFKTSGLEIVDLNIGALTPPPELQAAITKGGATIAEAMGTRGAMDALGNMQTYQQYQMANSLPEMAKNPSGGGQGLNMGAQLGMAMMVPSMMANAVKPLTQPQAAATPGVEIIEPKPDPFAKIKQLKELLDMGAITPEEFAKKKDELLKAI